jgi:hypothetical protein
VPRICESIKARFGSVSTQTTEYATRNGMALPG